MISRTELRMEKNHWRKIKNGEKYGYRRTRSVLRESLNLFLSLTIQFPAFLFALSTPLWLPESWRGIEIEIEKEREKEKKKKEKKRKRKRFLMSS